MLLFSAMTLPLPTPVPSALAPLTPEEIRRAEDEARNEDGTIDPFLFAAEIARPFGLGRSSTHPHFTKPGEDPNGGDR